VIETGVDMQSKAPTVSAYLKEVPADRKAALVRLRKLCRATLKGYKETMRYGGPGYEKNGVVEVGFMSQKHFIGFYITKIELLKAHKDKLKGISIGKSCIRYTKPEKIDYEIVQALLTGTVGSTNEI
jgi:uncharacterized protein YdhG (YjbR/CyaY superfamily)